ncbi:MAG: hypothetical protein EXX96DRAFT_601797 [Benjaminiella poitrasii]|nr:MAG: hypothetical protein EXX96DRAFT_601797 [Benjaminiella poitrasii]
MSTSGLIAAKKRIENSVRKYEIPVDSTAKDADCCQNGVLFLSLLQSRLNWTNAVFPKYKLDSAQQPKRSTSTRKKWPNMKYLGTCNLQLGTHLFMRTPFYEAVRTETWESIAKAQGLNVPEKEESLNEEQQKVSLKFVDIVFELKEIPNERFIFPKDTILEIIPLEEEEEEEEKTIHASFILPLDQTAADAFFMSPKEKLLKYGESSQLPYVEEFVKKNVDKKKKSKEAEEDVRYQPVNIRMTKTDTSLAEALKNYVHEIEIVRKSMNEKLKHAQQKKYIKFDLSDDPKSRSEIQELVKKVVTVPDITTGPIQAEKKRNEILNAIKLGKRERDEKFESELPKNKYINVKEDTSLKCAYCSTKFTTMWRSGPAGHGTLCNSCGIQWKQGEILIDAPVISMREERHLIKEKRERERTSELAEIEKAERETKRHQKKTERQSSNYQAQDLGRFAIQLLQQRHQQQNNDNTTTTTGSSDVSPAPEPITTTNSDNNIKNTKGIAAKSKTVSVEIKIAEKTDTNKISRQATKTEDALSPLQLQPQTTQQPQPQPQLQPQPLPPQRQEQPKPLSLYSPAGIPLPTLSIEFVGYKEFNHPNCGITLLDRCLSVRLCQDGSEQTTIELYKKDLMNASFEVVNELHSTAQQREVLKMKVISDLKIMSVFNQSIQIDDTHPILIKFLEKLDPSGGAVVQRILQRWLITTPHE